MPNVLNADLIIGFFSLAFGGVIFAVTRDLSHLGCVFINYVLIAILFLAVIMIIKGFVKPEKLTFFESVVERNNILIGLFILLVYLLFMPKVGFLPMGHKEHPPVSSLERHCSDFVFLDISLPPGRTSTDRIMVRICRLGGCLRMRYFFHDQGRRKL
jgi:hypothetical protein